MAWCSRTSSGVKFVPHDRVAEAKPALRPDRVGKLGAMLELVDLMPHAGVEFRHQPIHGDHRQPAPAKLELQFRAVDRPAQRRGIIRHLGPLRRAPFPRRCAAGSISSSCSRAAERLSRTARSWGVSATGVWPGDVALRSKSETARAIASRCRPRTAAACWSLLDLGRRFRARPCATIAPRPGRRPTRRRPSSAGTAAARGPPACS